MTGYNHYADCNCGWCVGGYRGRIDPTQLRRVLDWNDATRRLSGFGVRSISSCFIAPNARCPVCGCSVFYYENQFGSRVFFDHLGDGWPKHGCTDNSLKYPMKGIGRVAPRKAGAIQDILKDANTIGMFHNKTLGQRQSERSTILVVTRADRIGSENVIRARYIDSSRDEYIDLRCYSPDELFSVEDLISYENGIFYLVHPITLQILTFVADGNVCFAEDLQSATRQNATLGGADIKKARSARAFTNSTASREIAKKRSGKKNSFEKVKGNKQHFKNQLASVSEFCNRLKSYAHLESDTGSSLAKRLNDAGRKTANGSRWTDALASILLSYLKTHSRPQIGVRKNRSKGKRVGRRAARRKM